MRLGKKHLGLNLPDWHEEHVASSSKADTCIELGAWEKDNVQVLPGTLSALAAERVLNTALFSYQTIYLRPKPAKVSADSFFSYYVCCSSVGEELE